MAGIFEPRSSDARDPMPTALAEVPRVAEARPAAVTRGGSLVALARVEGGEARPERVFGGG